MSMPCWAALEISESASSPSRMRVKAHSSAERVPLRQCATTGAGSISQRCAKGVDIGARQCGGGDRDVVVGDPVRLGDAPRLGGRQLARVFSIGAIIDDRAHAGGGERIDVRPVEPAGDAHSGGQRKQLGWHAGPPR